MSSIILLFLTRSYHVQTTTFQLVSSVDGQRTLMIYLNDYGAQVYIRYQNNETYQIVHIAIGTYNSTKKNS